MAVSLSTSYDTSSLDLKDVVSLQNQTIVQDGARAAVLAQYTVLYQDPATAKWSPLISLAGSDGSELPQGILLNEDIAAADLVAGDVTGLDILTAGRVNQDKVVLENSLVVTGEIASQNKTVFQYLHSTGIQLQDVNVINA